MDDVLKTKVSDEDIAKAMANNNIDIKKLANMRKTRTIIRKFDNEPRPNDKCPCGSGKKFKKCCMGNGQYDGRRELTAQEMAEYKYNNVQISSFKRNLNITKPA